MLNQEQECSTTELLISKTQILEKYTQEWNGKATPNR